MAGCPDHSKGGFLFCSVLRCFNINIVAVRWKGHTFFILFSLLESCCNHYTKPVKEKLVFKKCHLAGRA